MMLQEMRLCALRKHLLQDRLDRKDAVFRSRPVAVSSTVRQRLNVCEIVNEKKPQVTRPKGRSEDGIRLNHPLVCSSMWVCVVCSRCCGR